MEDICVMLDGYKFNYRVAAIIKKDGKILLHKSKKDNFYAIPGGRVKVGESSIKTLKREFIEEMGKDINVKDFTGLVENFFEYNGKADGGNYQLFCRAPEQWVCGRFE